jgi:5-methylcytosine-specific restriction endonuclease McrA
MTNLLGPIGKKTSGFRGVGWKLQRKVVLKRDGYRCVKCGATKGLQVHHIKKWEGESDNFLENLITICSICHHKLHAEEKHLEVRNNHEAYFY